jgi:glycosyltransferase involved in cell wall biosynthesis
MSCGLPVIGTDVVGINDVIHHGSTGLLCRRNKEHIADAMLHVVRRPRIAQKMGSDARKQVKETFSIEKSIEEELRIYDFIADSFS